MNTTINTHNSRRLVNQEVQVTGVYFRSRRPDDQRIKSYPKRMEYEGREYTFVESGLRYLIRKGQQLIEVFDMTDGESNYRLRFDADIHKWTLVGISEGSYAI